MVRRVAGLIRKELAQVARDRPLMVILLWAFTAAIYSAGHGRATETMHVATAVYDLSQSPESRELISHLQPPYFKTVAYLHHESEIPAWLDRGKAASRLRPADSRSAGAARCGCVVRARAPHDRASEFLDYHGSRGRPASL